MGRGTGEKKKRMKDNVFLVDPHRSGHARRCSRYPRLANFYTGGKGKGGEPLTLGIEVSTHWKVSRLCAFSEQGQLTRFKGSWGNVGKCDKNNITAIKRWLGALGGNR